MAMVNLLLGPPGGGKSYEAVVFHVLPALASGRRVITNLPLNLEALAAVDASYPGLVVKRENRPGLIKEPAGGFGRYRRSGSTVETMGVIRAFSTVEDYGDPWRHPENGAGPLYVIDECHLALPVGRTDIKVEEWFSMIRHETADALLITQSFGKISRAIVDLVQICYRVRKGTAWGASNHYVRKVVDGVRGDTVNTSVRKYEKRFFGLYQSHTKGGGSELDANDIVPIWRRWPVIGAALMFVLGIGMFLVADPKNPLDVASASRAAAVVPQISTVTTAPAPSPAAKVVTPEVKIVHPLAGRTLHVSGSMRSKKGVLYLFTVAQNGQAVMSITSAELVRLGYTVPEGGEACAVKVGFGDWSAWVLCDAPQIGMVTSGDSAVSGSRSDSVSKG